MILNVEEPEALIDYLRCTGRIGSEENPSVEPLSGGISNRTVLVRREAKADEDWVIKQALPKLRVEHDWYSDPARVHHEASGLRWLERLLPVGSVPRFVFEDRQHHVLGMTAVAEPHENWKSRLLLGRLDAKHVHQFAKLLAQMHRSSNERRDELALEFDDRTFFESLRLEPYYAFAAAQVPDAASFLSGLIDQTRQRRLTLVHGDYSPKNVLIHADQLVLLDHEVIHWGDPAFDIGFSLTHLLSKAHHVAAHRTAFAAASVTYWHDYATAIGTGPWQDGLEQHAVRHTIGCLLARVAGRSPLEYLSESERTRQRRVILDLLAELPQTIENLVARFIERLKSVVDH